MPFDTLELTSDLKQAGFQQEQAEKLAKVLSKNIDKYLVSKSEQSEAIKDLKLYILGALFGQGALVVAILSFMYQMVN